MLRPFWGFAQKGLSVKNFLSTLCGIDAARRAESIPHAFDTREVHHNFSFFLVLALCHALLRPF